MAITSLEGLSDGAKSELIASLSAIVVGSSGADVTAESITAVASASGNDLSGAWASIFATVCGKAGGVEKFCLAPGSGGGGGGGGGGDAGGAEEAVVAEVEEEEEAPAATDLFGGDDGGGGDY